MPDYFHLARGRIMSQTCFKRQRAVQTHTLCLVQGEVTEAWFKGRVDWNNYSLFSISAICAVLAGFKTYKVCFLASKHKKIHYSCSQMQNYMQIIYGNTKSWIITFLKIRQKVIALPKKFSFQFCNEKGGGMWNLHVELDKNVDQIRLSNGN